MIGEVTVVKTQCTRYNIETLGTPTPFEKYFWVERVHGEGEWRTEIHYGFQERVALNDEDTRWKVRWLPIDEGKALFDLQQLNKENNANHGNKGR